MKPGEGALYFIFKDTRCIRSRLTLHRARRLEKKLTAVIGRQQDHRMSRPVYWIQLNVTDDRASEVPDRTYSALLGTKDQGIIDTKKAEFIRFCRLGRHSDWRHAWAAFDPPPIP